MSKWDQKAESEGGRKHYTCALECQTGHTRPQVQSCGTLGPESWPLTSPHLFCLLQEGRRNRGLGPSGYFSTVSQPSTPKPSSSAFPWHSGHCPEGCVLPGCPGGLSKNPREVISAPGTFKQSFSNFTKILFRKKMIKTDLDPFMSSNILC